MSHLVVIAFELPNEAQEVHRALVEGKKAGLLSINDAAIVTKDKDGKVHVDNHISSGTWAGMGWGGALGLLLSGIFFPVAGIAVGAAGGALVARMMHTGVDGKFVKEVQDQIAPGTSALFVLTDNEQLSAELAILRQHHGKVLQTNLPEDAEEAMREALGDKSTNE